MSSLLEASLPTVQTYKKLVSLKTDVDIKLAQVNYLNTLGYSENMIYLNLSIFSILCSFFLRRDLRRVMR